MKHITSEDLADRRESQDSDVIGVFDEEAMVIEQSWYQSEEAEEVSARTHTQDEFYCILSGSGTMRVREEINEVKEGDMIYVDAGAEHDFFDIDGELRTLKVFASP
ncbi:MAG: cupin domain-containing protein [Halovenus sp.]